jgi:hypothetical protein
MNKETLLTDAKIFAVHAFFKMKEFFSEQDRVFSFFVSVQPLTLRSVSVFGKWRREKTEWFVPDLQNS